MYPWHPFLPNLLTDKYTGNWGVDSFVPLELGTREDLAPCLSCLRRAPIFLVLATNGALIATALSLQVSSIVFVLSRHMLTGNS